MTEYGRSPGSEPWHPEDPLYGDQGWGGQQQHYPQQQYPQQPQQADYNQQDPYAQGYGGQQYPQQYGEQQYGGQPGQGYDTSGQGYDTSGYPVQQPYDGGWDTGQHQAMPYGAPPADPYGAAQPQDLYGTPEAYPPPQPPGRRQGPPEPVNDWQSQEPEEENHPFFTGEDVPEEPRRRRGRAREAEREDAYDDDYDDEPDSRSSRGGGRDRRGKGQKKGRNGFACLFVALVLVGGVGGVGYVGYQFWQGQFGSAPDFEGAGSGSVQVEIPKAAGGYEIGNILKEAGVVKSVDAFVSAQQKNPKGLSIQAGVYTLKKGMSAASAVELMLDPVSKDALVLFPGMRNVKVYAEIDRRLALQQGTTQGVAKAKAKELGLPAWALNHKDVKDPLEGFLYPGSYPVAKGSKPEAVLKKMVTAANAEYDRLELESKAKSVGLQNPWELVTAASLVQAEGTSHDDFKKMAEVIYNRLKPSNPQTWGRLEFDSTYNYIKNQSKIDLTLEELRKYDNQYNTYYYKGLPPGPIGNPGPEALRGVLSPTSDGWYYFISIDGKTSKFTRTYAEHQKLVNEFNKSRKNG
ncbi:endolytic transglycosylase MltG [Streptomyces sp. NPDC048604]|uniref:endolytic transglycosylase MltG n=1 Tax=Streptomyces sp. NPDC048604 TaxID=3365578 RepID=UPI0037197631